MDRRGFLKTGTAGLALSSIGHHVAAAEQSQPNKVALIGCGWYGKSVLFRHVQVAPIEIVALCDVDKNMLNEAADMAAQRQASKKRPRTYCDFRELLAKEDIDIVQVSTPDHWHAVPAIEAIKAGRHVYTEKPTGVDVVESQAMLAAARKYDRVVQVNTQRRSTPHLIEARDKFIKSGRLGKIGMVEVCCYYHMRARQNPPDAAPPDYLDWEMWTGPAPLLPYNTLAHPRRWRAYMEYSNGIVGDMCVHMLDMVRWMLDIGWPTRVSSSAGIFTDKESRANISDTQTAMFEYPDDELNIVWNHRSWGHAPDKDYPWAAIFYGDKGTLRVSVQRYDFIPRGGEPERGEVCYELEKYPEDKTEKGLEKHVAPAIRAHLLDFRKAIATRERPVADIEQAHISSTACILANMSAQLGRTLQWDADKGRVVGDDEANRLLARPYREPWVHPDPKTV